MKARDCTNHAVMWILLWFWCCLHFFIKSVCLSLKAFSSGWRKSDVVYFLFHIFSRLIWQLSPLSHHSYSFTSAFIIALIPCLPPYIPVSPCFCSPPLSNALSHIPGPSFLLLPPSHSLLISINFYVYLSLLINKWLKRKRKLIGTRWQFKKQSRGMPGAALVK